MERRQHESRSIKNGVILTIALEGRFNNPSRGTSSSDEGSYLCTFEAPLVNDYS
jgi:hypothetical protein